MKTLLVLIIASGVFVTACGPSGAEATPTGPPAAATEPAATPPSGAPAPARDGVSAQPPGLGIAFEHATGLKLRPCDGDAPRCVTLSDPAAEAFMRDLLTAQVFDGPLEAVAASEGGFQRDAEGRLMTTYGRFEPVPVERFEVNGKPGMTAVITCGISDSETGFHAAAGECLWAVVSDGTRSVVVSSSGFGNGLDAAGIAVSTVRFLPTR